MVILPTLLPRPLGSDSQYSGLPMGNLAVPPVPLLPLVLYYSQTMGRVAILSWVNMQ